MYYPLEDCSEIPFKMPYYVSYIYNCARFLLTCRRNKSWHTIGFIFSLRKDHSFHIKDQSYSEINQYRTSVDYPVINWWKTLPKNDALKGRNCFDSINEGRHEFILILKRESSANERALILITKEGVNLFFYVKTDKLCQWINTQFE